MNVKLTIVLLLILAGLTVVVLLGDRGPEVVKDEGLLFPQFVAADVRGLSWSSGGVETAVSRVEGKPDEWTVTVAGLEVPADADEIEEVLSEVGRCNVMRRIPAGEVGVEARADYGLTPETRKVRVTMRGAIVEAVLGVAGVMRDTTYARRSTEDDVLLVDHGLAEAIADRGAEKVRARRILDWSVYDTDRMSVERAGATDGPILVVERSAAERAIFLATVPYRGFVDPKLMESELLPAVLQLEASEFAADGVKDGDLPKYGLDAPRFVVAVTKREGGQSVERRVLVGADVPEKEGMVYVMESGRPFVYACVGQKLLGHLGADPVKWRDRNLTRLGWKPVDRIVSKYGDVSFEAERMTAEWNLVSPEKMVLDERAVDDWFKVLREMEVEGFIDAPDAAALGLAEPRGEIVLYPPKVKPEEGEEEKPAEPVVRILVGADRDDGPGVYAMLAGAASAFRVGPALPDLMKDGHQRLRKKAVLGVDFGTKEVTSLRRAKAGETEDLTRVEGVWPEGVRGAAVTTVAKEVLDLTAVRWVGKAEGHEEEYGVAGGGWLECRVKLRDRDTTVETEYGVVVGAETEGGRFARAIREGRAEPDVFVLSPAVLVKLEAPLREPEKVVPPDEAEDPPPPEEPDGPKDTDDPKAPEGPAGPGGDEDPGDHGD
ncbi:MAG: DUF4340 domain-containing protein [Planctomycetes bacterium]|jgi:hypothetical protein|nr:DUF4340 domain-containing protein [Planctomycetota bacterium]